MTEPFATYNTIFNVFFYCTGCTSVVLNVSLLCMVITKKGTHIKEYRILLANSALIDLIKSLGLTFVQPRIITIQWVYAYVANGPSKYFGSYVSYFAYSICLNMSFYSYLYLVLSFGYRYYVLKMNPLSLKKLFIVCLLTYSIVFLQLLITLASESNPNYIREILTTYKPEYDWNGAVIYGNDCMRNPITFITVFTVVFPIFPIYISITRIRRMVHSLLNSDQLTLSNSTKELHKRLLEALTLQAAVPLVFIFPPIFVYFFQHMGILRAPLIEYLIFALVSVTPSVDALVTLYCVHPYRDAILWFFCRRHSAVMENVLIKSKFSNERSGEWKSTLMPAANMPHGSSPINAHHSNVSRMVTVVPPCHSKRPSIAYGPFQGIAAKMESSPVKIPSAQQNGTTDLSKY